MLILKIITTVAFASMNITSLLLAIYALMNFKEIGDLKIFIILPILSFIDSFSLILFGHLFDNENAFVIFSEYFQIIFLNYELAIIIFFYLNIILKVKNNSIKIIPIITTSIFIILRYLNGLNISTDYLPIIVIIEALIVNICFGFLVSRKIKDDEIIIKQSSNEINKGLFLFVNTTAPYYLVINYLDNHQEIAAKYLNFIGSFGYTILFYHIYKAIKCYRLK